MVDSGYNRDIYKSAKSSTGTVMRNAEMLKFVPDYFKIKIINISKHAVERPTICHKICS